MGKIDWDVVTNYTDVVTTTLKTVTFPKVQEQVYLRNQGNANITYTIGSQSGILTPGQSVTVNQDVSSYTVQAVSGTHTFELRAKEKGTEIIETDNNLPSDVSGQLTSITSQLADITKYWEHEAILEKLNNKEPVTIVCYGDSITWGYVPNTGVQTANPYPSVLQTLLREYYNYNNITVVNKGNSGKQSDEFASDSYVSDALASNPDLILFMCGINDCRSSGSGGAIVPVGDYKENLRIAIKKLQKPVVLMTPTPIFDTDETKNDRINDYVIAMKSVANKLGVKLIDLNAIVRKDLKTRNIKWEDIALDNIHYVDSYYTRLAEFIFSFGLAPSDIIVKDETFLNAEHPAFVFPQSRAYFTSNANPEKSNIWLYGDDSTKQQAWLYVFVDEKAVDLIVYNIFNPSTSNANKVNIDGVDYPVPSYLNNGNTFWNVKQNILKLAYGLHKIKFWAVSQDTTHKHFLLNGVEFKKNANEPKTTGGLLTGTKKILDGSLNFKSTGASTITFNELLTLEKKKYNITFQAISGYGFGLGSFEARNGTDIRKFPFLILCQTGDKFNAFVLTVSNNSTADFNTYSYYQLVIGSVAATAGDNLLELNITDTLINAKINGTQCLALDNTIFPQKFVPDLWLYASKNDSALSVTKIEEVLG